MEYMKDTNTEELYRLLHIPNPEKESIFGVIGRMEVLLDLFKKDEKYHNLLPFLKTYYFVTKAAAEKYIQQKHFFRNIREYETLDVYFASLYFRPLSAYLIEKEYETPWKTYFSYCDKRNGIPFLQMLLGINAHINANLYTALVDLEYRNQRDFFLVNDILLEVCPDVIRFMAFTEHDLFSFGGLILKDFFLAQFHQVIEKWRSEAWANASYRQHKHFTKQKNESSSLHLAHKTEEIGIKLIQDFENLEMLPKLPELIDRLTSPSVVNSKKQRKK